MDSARSTQPRQLGLLFAATALAVAALAFVVGYRAPQPSSSSASVRATPAASEEAGAAATSQRDTRSGSASAVDRDGLQVIGFAKIGFAEMEELLTTASPEQREEWARELGALPEQPLKMIALVAYYVAWLDLQPEEALRSLRDFPDILNRSRVFSALVSAVPPAILPQLVDVVAELTGPERAHLLPQFLAALSETDPQTTARFLDSHPQLVSSADAEELISAWAADDVTAATQWLEASQFANDGSVLHSLVSQWLAKDAAAAQRFVLRHRQGAAINTAAASVASHLLATSPAEAREFISLFGPERSPAVVSAMISAAEDNQLPSVADFAASLPAMVDESSVAAYALVRWNRVDAPQALAWLRAQPVEQRELLLADMIHSDPVPSPEMVSLVYTIRDAQQRDSALASIVATLSETSEGTAEQQIRALDLPAAQVNHLLGILAGLGD